MDREVGNKPSKFLDGNSNHTFDISYADDTFLAGLECSTVQRYLHRLITVANKYGLEPNWSKTVHMRIHHHDPIFNPNGDEIGTATQAQYLGTLLTNTGSSSLAVGRRIGEASSIFDSLCDIWKHASLTRHRKIEVYKACVISKLMFALECECLKQADWKRLNSFHCRCLRRILKIPVSWISHVPNNVVLAAASSRPLSENLLQQQLLLFGKIAQEPNSKYIRQLTFHPSSVNPARCLYRRRGRPRLAWQSVLYAHAVQSAPHGHQQISNLLLGGNSLTAWREHVELYF